MMLVVAVALSTATYAWFTSNTKVEASNISLTAATSIGAAFGISWTDANYSSALTGVAAPAANSFNPLVPASYSVVENSETETSVVFATATIRQEGGAEKYNTDVKVWSTTEEAKAAGERVANYNTAAKPYIWNDGTGAGQGHTSFYIKNLSTSNGQDHLYVYADVTGAASDLVRIAIFDTGKLVGILGYTYTYTAATTWDDDETYYVAVTGGYLLAEDVTSENFESKKAGLYVRSAGPIAAATYYGTVTANANVLTDNSPSSLYLDLNAFAAEEAREITVYVWLDGKVLNDDTQGTGAGINLHFDVEQPSFGA